MCMSADEPSKLRGLADRHREVIVTLLDRARRFEKAGVERRVIDALWEEARVRANAARSLDATAAAMDGGVR